MGKSTIIIDVREPFEYQMGHAEGAINIPPAELMTRAQQLKGVDKDTQLVVYCRTGSRSNASIQILQRMGFTNLVNGINAEHVTKNYLS